MGSYLLDWANFRFFGWYVSANIDVVGNRYPVAGLFLLFVRVYFD